MKNKKMYTNFGVGAEYRHGQNWLADGLQDK